MKHLTKIVIMFILVAVLTGCQNSTDGQNNQVNKNDKSEESVTFNIEDVNTDSNKYYTCFNNNFKSCTPAKCSFDGEFINGQGRVQITKEIKGLKNGKCEVSETYGIYEAQPAFKNKTMTCLYPKYSSGNSSYTTVEDCKGDLAELMQL